MRQRQQWHQSMFPNMTEAQYKTIEYYENVTKNGIMHMSDNDKRQMELHLHYAPQIVGHEDRMASSVQAIFQM